MLRLALRLGMAAILAVLAASPVAAASAAGGGGGGGNFGMTVSIGTPIQLQNRLLATVPITVSCVAELDSVGGGFVGVTIQQAYGKQVSHGMGFAFFNSCTQTPQTFVLQVTPDVQPVPSGPFKGGSAIAQAYGSICDFGVFPQTCYSGSTNWTPVKL